MLKTSLNTERYLREWFSLMVPDKTAGYLTRDCMQAGIDALVFRLGRMPVENDFYLYRRTFSPNRFLTDHRLMPKRYIEAGREYLAALADERSAEPDALWDAVVRRRYERSRSQGIESPNTVPLSDGTKLNSRTGHVLQKVNGRLAFEKMLEALSHYGENVLDDAIHGDCDVLECEPDEEPEPAPDVPLAGIARGIDIVLRNPPVSAAAAASRPGRCAEAVMLSLGMPTRLYRTGLRFERLREALPGFGTVVLWNEACDYISGLERNRAATPGIEGYRAYLRAVASVCERICMSA